MRETLRSDGRQIALDGKTICSTAKGAREKLHILTAYEVERGITLGQLCLSESDKTNEIPTVKQLLEIIDIRGKIITADAMRRQLETAAKIVSDDGDYVFGLKGNQPNLLNDVELYIQDCISDKDIQVESASVCGKHGSRGERRTYYVSSTLDWLSQKREWKGLKKAFAIHRVVTEKGLKQEEWSYYITSLDASAAELNDIVRKHWRIESMHWILDVVFDEDESQVISKNGLVTLNIMRKLALAVWKQFISSLPRKTKPSIKKQMLKALMSPEILADVLIVKSCNIL